MLQKSSVDEIRNAAQNRHSRSIFPHISSWTELDAIALMLWPSKPPTDGKCGILLMLAVDFTLGDMGDAMRASRQIGLPQSRSDLEPWLDAQSQRERLPITVIPVICSESPAGILKRDHNILVSERDGLWIAEFLPLYSQASPPGRAQLEERSPGGIALVTRTEHADIWMLSTTGKSGFVKRIQTDLQAYRRQMPQFSFNNLELRRLIDAISKAGIGREIVATQASLRVPTGKTNTIREHHIHPGIFGLATDSAASVQTLHVSCRGSSTTDFTLFREGSCRIAPGSWNRYCHQVQPLLLDAVNRKLTLLKGRARTSFEMLGRPVFIRYDEGVFNGRGDNLRLVNALQAAGTNSVAVRHINPYLHATVTDLLDGAQFDVFVTSDRVLTLVPGYSATEGALMRLVRAVFDSVHEGAELSDVSDERELTLADLMGAPCS